MIRKATVDDREIIAHIGRIAVWDSHKDSCPAKDLDEYLAEAYNDEEVQKELANTENIYHIIYHRGQPAGFSKIELDTSHVNVIQERTTKLDRIYLLKEFYGLRLGYALLQFNIELSKACGQTGMWLFTWVGNQRAIDFYNKTRFTTIGTHSFKLSETHANPNHHMLLKY